MSTYTVVFTTTAYAYVKVEADSPDEARRLADETFEAPYICAQCSGWGKSADRASLELGDAWEMDESEGGAWES